LGVLLGAEGAGLSEAMVAAADELVTIPMRPPVESLNVAITAALILYESSQQRARRPHVAIR
jgi:RNA methyltransferase, TrmH family